jgi:hypothetical protein
LAGGASSSDMTSVGTGQSLRGNRRGAAAWKVRRRSPANPRLITWNAKTTGPQRNRLTPLQNKHYPATCRLATGCFLHPPRMRKSRLWHKEPSNGSTAIRALALSLPTVAQKICSSTIPRFVGAVRWKITSESNSRSDKDPRVLARSPYPRSNDLAGR